MCVCVSVSGECISEDNNKGVLKCVCVCVCVCVLGECISEDHDKGVLKCVCVCGVRRMHR